MSQVETRTDSADEARREAEFRIADLERQILLEEARRLDGTDEDTSPRPGDPPQPAEAPPVADAVVARQSPLTAARIIKRALTKEGYRESATEVSEFGAWYGINPGAWCAMFASWVFYTEGLPLPAKEAKGFSYCGDGVAYFKARGQWKPASTRPQPGWLIFFNWADTKETYDHVGIVMSVNADGSIHTIEGNVSAPNGGPRGVFQKNRKVGILGYGAPVFAAAAPSSDGLPLLKQSNRPTGAPVRRAQGLLRAADSSLTDASFPLNGSFDDATVRRVKAFQSAHPPLTSDGEVGPKTWDALLGLKRS